MKKIIIFALITLFLMITSNGQIKKGNWLLGGNVNFSSAQYNSDAATKQDLLTIGIQPEIGYFLIDKFSTGLLIKYQFSRSKIPTAANKVSTLDIGPYLRYYFLSPEERINIFSEISYQYGVSKSNDNKSYKSNSFSFLAGPVVYFNTTVGIEFTIGYSTSKYLDYNGRNNSFLIGLGLQVHLEKE